MKAYKDGLVSIVMPAYNAAQTIEASIESVLAQDYSKWELIVVNDCSRDATKEIVERFASRDSRVKLITLEKNSGISKARNTAIRNATGQYLAFLDSDDLWKPEKLSRQLKFMTTGGYSFTFTSYELMDSQGNLLKKTIPAKREVDYKTLLTNNCIGCLTVLIDRSNHPTVIMPYLRHEDYATWLNLLRRGAKAFGLNVALSIYRVSEGSTSSNKLKVIPWIWSIYRKSEGFGIFKSSLLLSVNICKLVLKYFKAGLLKKVFKRA